VAVSLLGLGPVASAAAPCANSGLPGTPYEGFGADTAGGAGQPVYRVTSLADAGPGTLRDALSAGNRCIVFDVAGEIALTKQIFTKGAFVTVDGFTAPAPGISVRDYGISIWGSQGAHDVIVRGLRFRNAGQKTCAAGSCWDGIQIKNGAYRVVIDHVSSDHASDGALDITSQDGTLTRDVTVQWSILSGTVNQAGIGRAARVSMHHNLFIGGQNRNPEAGWDASLSTAPPDTVLDLRNNVMWNYSAYGTVISHRGTANVVNNYYYSSSRPTAEQALVVSLQGRAHARGNVSGNGADVNARTTERAEFSTAGVATTDACFAAYEVQDEAGARGGNFGPDAVDARHLSALPPTQLPGCAPPAVVSVPAPTPDPTPVAPRPVSAPTSAPRPQPVSDLVVSSLSSPATVSTGLGFPIHLGVTNRGASSTGGSRVKIYLSANDRPSSGNLLLRDRAVPPLAAGASHFAALTEVVPSEVVPGSYYLLVVSDPAANGLASGGHRSVAAARVSVTRPTSSTPTPDLVTSVVSMPSQLRRGAGFPLSFVVANRGTGTAQPSRVNVYLATRGTRSATDVLLRSRYVGPLAPGASQSHLVTEVIPTRMKAGTYYVLLAVDEDRAVKEAGEGNNVTAAVVTVR
jgi:pectate lyase